MTNERYMDELDEQLRAGSRALEGQVPDRYFDLLPNRILARLEETMESDVNRPRSSGPKQGVPTVNATRAREDETDKVEARKEDSGLSDIRAMARSTKQRISQQRISQRIPTQNPAADDDILATSSSSLRAVALPVANLPAEHAALGNGTGSAATIPTPAAAKATATAASDSKTAMRAAPITPLAPKKSKAPLVAAGAAVAALAAGVAGYVVLRQQDDTGDRAAARAPQQPATGIAQERKEEAKPAAAAPAPAIVTTPAPALDVSGRAALIPEESGAAAAAGSNSLGKADEADEDKKARDQGSRRDRGRDKSKDDKDVKKAPAPEKTPTTSTTQPKKGPADKQAESLDDLLRKAGVDPDATKKQQAAKLDKKELNAADIRSAMSALNGKAQACYAKFGVSGSVPVKLMVAPSGEVKKATVTGSFAGTPTGDCVQKAASGAKFPAWDGAAMTVNYSYFLSE